MPKPIAPKCARCARTCCLIVLVISVSALAGSSARIKLAPKYLPGETFTYRVDSTTTTTGKITTAILNPEGATKSSVSIHLLVRFDALDVPANSAPGSAHFRAKYEKSTASSQSDAFDPAQPSASALYSRLQSRSFEFTIDPDAKIANISGLQDIFRDPSAQQSELSWLGELQPAAAFPLEGIAIGQKWKSERPLENAPFSDLVSRSESTYLRDEPCHASPGTGAPSNQGGEAPETCAVILTRFTISRRGSSHSDATAEPYLRNGLRVTGSINGSGESLDYISPASGFLVRSTQTSDQQMDYTVATATGGSTVHNQRHVQSQSEINLASFPAMAPAKR